MLSAQSNLAEIKHQQIATYVNRLRQDIQEKVKVQPMGYLTDAVTLATKIEEQNKRRLTKQSVKKLSWCEPS